MSSNLLLGDNAEGRDHDPGAIVDRASAWTFIRSFRNAEIKIRLDLLEEDGYSFEYRDGAEIMVDRTVDEMVELYYEWVRQLPGLPELLNIVMRDIGDVDDYSDENAVEELMTNIEDDLRCFDLIGSDLRVTIELLEDLIRDMYNYFGFALLNTKLVRDEKIWEFLNVKESHMAHGKLYITTRIYVEGLRDLDYMNERADVDFVEIVNEIKNLFVLSEESRVRRALHGRDRDRGLTNRLLE